MGSTLQLPTADDAIRLVRGKERWCSGCLKYFPLKHFRVTAKKNLPVCRDCFLLERDIQRVRDELAKPTEYRKRGNSARTQVNKALRAGRLVRPTHCQECHQPHPLLRGYHSHGYENLLDVDWLCPKCMGGHHRGWRKVEQPQAQDVKVVSWRLTQQRRNVVARLYARMKTAADIAAVLNVAEGTVLKDIAAIRSQIKGELARASAFDVGAELEINHRALKTIAFQLLDPRPSGTTALDVTEQVAVLNFIKNAVKEHVATMQRLGIVYEAPKKLGIQATFDQKLAALPTDIAQLIANETDQNVFMALLAEHMGADVVTQLLGAGEAPLDPANEILSTDEHEPGENVDGEPQE